MNKLKILKVFRTRHRRITAMMLAICMVFHGLPITALADTEFDIIYGDVNRDKVVDADDVTELKKYLAEYDIDIDEEASDVNIDGQIDMADLLKLEKYVAGLDVILGESCTITFDTDGGSNISPILIKKGSSLEQTPQTSKEGYTFHGWFLENGQPFYGEDTITSDLTLYAKYDKLPPKETLTLTSFSLSDQPTTLSFDIISNSEQSEEEIKNQITLTPMDGSEPIELTVSLLKEKHYKVKATTGFIPGASYELALAEGLNFYEKADTIRTASFTIYKEEVMNLSLNNDIIYIKDTEDMSYLLRGETKPVEVLNLGLLSSETTSTMEGTFEYTQGDLSVGDILCIYEQTDPRNRDYVNGDYQEDSVAYIEITNISGSTISFKSLDESAVQDVVFMPDTIPFTVATLPNDSGNVESDSFDKTAWNSMGNVEDPVFDVGDFLVFYQGEFENLTDDSAVFFGKVTAIDEGSITYIKSTVDEMENSMNLFLENPVKGETLLDNVDTEQLEDKIEEQVLQSGFAKDAAYYLANSAIQTDGFKTMSNLKNLTLTEESGKAVTAQQLRGIGGSVELSDDISITVELDKSSKYFKDGIRLALGIKAEFAVDVGDEEELKVELSATFVEEIAVDIDTDVKAKWKWYFIIPVLKDLTFRASVDLKNYAGISIEVKVGGADVSEELTGLLNLTSETQLDAGVQNLMERYSQMLQNESDWIEILNKEIIQRDIVVFIFAIGIDVNFIIKGNINLALGANMEYVIGKRYSFWINIFSGTSGNSQMDLLDERFAFQFYVMGELGLKMGVEARISVGIFSTKVGSIGVSAEFGPYVKLWGYFIYEYSKLRPANTNTWEYDEKMMGALYLEFGIYLEMKFQAQLFNEALKYEPTLLDKEWPLLTVGERNNVYDFAYEIDESESLLVKDNDNNSSNGITMELPEGYRLMNRIDLCEGDMDQYAYGIEKFHYTMSNKHFGIDKDTGVITVEVPDNVQYMQSNLTITWKMDKLAFSLKDISVTIPLVWTNLATDELNEKFTASVKVGNAKDGYLTVWSSRVNKNQPFNLPTEQEILKLISYDSYNGPAYGNLKYEGYAGYGEQQLEELAIASDTSYYFEVTPREYTITINDVENRNGTKDKRSVTAKIGERFPIEFLKNTGTNEPESNQYTSFLRVLAEDSAGNEITFDNARVLDMGFAKEILDKATYTAVYADNSATVTYTFEGINLADKVIKVKKGSTPPDLFTEELNALNAIVTSITPGIGPVLGSTMYTIICKVAEKPIMKHTVTYETNGGTKISSQEYPEGTAMLPPVEPTKNGYNFGGWYSDEVLKTPFDFTVMPSKDITIYVKWLPKEYQVTLDANEGSLPEDTANPITVAYGEAYGTLPTPTRTGYAFQGWFTNRVSGELITSTTMVNLMDHQTLYAQWGRKATIDQSMLQFATNQIHDYNTTHQPVQFSTGESGIAYDSFHVEYKRQGLDTTWKSEAVNAGTYDVRITRPEDDKYRSFEKMYTAVMTINKIARTITADPMVKETLYACLLIEDLPKGAYLGDGTVEYAVSTSKTIPTTGWQQSKAFVNLPKGNYYLFVRVKEGENYLATSNTAVSTIAYSVAGITRNTYGYDYYTYIKTSDVSKAGTDAIIGGTFSFYDGTSTTWSHFDNSANDFERNGGDFYAVNTSNALEPWMINSALITYEKKSTSAGWHCAYFYPHVRNSSNTQQYITGSMITVNRWFEDSTDSQSGLVGESMKRRITSVGNFNSDSAYNGFIRSMSLNENSSEDTFTYDGLIKDQYAHFGTSYNVYQHSDAPALSVNCAGYEEYFNVGINTITLKSGALYQAMTKDGVNEINATVTLQFPTRSTTADTATWTKQVTFTLDQLSGMVQSRSITNSSMMRAGIPVRPMISTVINQQNGLVDVTLNMLDNAGIWGVKAEVAYDHNLLTLIQDSVGEVFDVDEITPPESLTKEKYIFLASRNKFTNTDQKGKLVTLRFKVNKDIELTDYPIALRLVQAINASSDKVEVGLSQAYQNIDVSKPVVVVNSGNYVSDTWTKDKVTLSITNATPNLGTTNFMYQKDGGEWKSYKEPIVIANESGKMRYSFKAISESGIESEIETFIVKRDTKSPSSSISIGENSWTQYLDTIDYDLCYHSAQIVTVNATDGESGVKKVQYYVSDKKVDDPNTIADWTEYVGSFDLIPDNKYVIYVRVIDHAGNSVIINSDGIFIENAQEDSDEEDTETDVPEPDEGDEDTEPETGDGNTPKTGDNSNIALWIALLFVSGGVLAAMGITQKRRKKSM